MTATVELAAAYAAGRTSRADGVTRNPHATTAADATPRTRSLAAAWQRGRQHTSPHRAAFDELAEADDLDAVTE